MSNKYILNPDGSVEATDLTTWARWFETGDRIIAQDTVDESRVSTVFIGIDHNFGASGPPLLFETMVFDGPLDGEQDRYATKAEALAGHAVMLARVNVGAK